MFPKTHMYPKSNFHRQVSRYFHCSNVGNVNEDTNMNGSTGSRNLTHVDLTGKANMVNVGHKHINKRSALACGRVNVGTDVAGLIKKNCMKKGDVLTVARIAGIQAAKRTSEMIPLCHNICISAIKVDAALEEETNTIIINAFVEAEGKTGVEMEALTAVAVAALTVYDMCKAVTHDIVIQEVKLMQKTGGERGDFKRGDIKKTEEHS